MKRRVGIIGTGWVGSSVAISTLHSGAADEVLLNDLVPELAEGEAMDLSHGASFYPTAEVRTAAITEMAGADVVVVSAGRGGRPGESRLDLLRENVQVIKELGRQLAGCSAIIVVVTNPVDVLTRMMVKASGLPPTRVIGTGTMLDTARLQQSLGRVLRLDPRSVNAQVVGEHGDSEVVLWSSARIGGVPLRKWPGWTAAHEAQIAGEVRTAAQQIIQRKGATNHAIGLVTAELLRCMLRGERRILTVSTVQETNVDLKGVALSLPTIVGAQGNVEVLSPEMSTDEHQELRRSADVLDRAFADLGESG